MEAASPIISGTGAVDVQVDNDRDIDSVETLVEFSNTALHIFTGSLSPGLFGSREISNASVSRSRFLSMISE